MKLNQYLNGIENKNKIRNLFISNTRYNHITPIQSFKSFNPLILSPINDIKINIDFIKIKYGYINNNSSKNILDKISKIKEKYFQDYSKNNLIMDSKNLTILNKGKNKNNKTLSESKSIDKNIWENNFQFQKQNSIYFNKEIVINKKNDKIKTATARIQSPLIIKNEDFFIIDKVNNENSNNINKIFHKEFSIKSKNKEEYIYPISRRIKLLKK